MNPLCNAVQSSHLADNFELIKEPREYESEDLKA